MDAETKGFAIDGVNHPVPDPDGLSMGEAMKLDLYGVQLVDIGPGSTLTVGVIASLMHVAIQRKQLGLTDAAARKIVERQNVVAALEAFADEEADADPLDVTTSDSENASSSTSSTGKDFENGSESSPAAAPRPTGPSRLVTPSTSDRVTSRT